MDMNLEKPELKRQEYICECGKVVLKKNFSKHLRSIKHDYWRLKKDSLERVGDWTSEYLDFEVNNPFHEKEE
jgi:hypothetical protein